MKIHLPKMRFGLSWIIALPIGIWGILGYYLPLLGGTLDRGETWIVAIICVFLAAASLSLHVLSHIWTAWIIDRKLPSEIHILIFGETSQRWPDNSKSHQMILIAIAGPLANLLLATLAYFAWNAQSNNVIGLSVMFLCGFNAWLFLINLIPAYPFDGGRFLLAGLKKTYILSETSSKFVRILGWLFAGLITAWGVFLLLQHSRFSLETGLITFLFTIIMVDGLRVPSEKWVSDHVHARVRTWSDAFRYVFIAVICLTLLTTASGLLLTNDGIDAPGVALSIAPMIKLPVQYRHNFPGEYYLVTVVSQAPITAGEWLLGKIDPAFEIVPPEQVTPKNTTPQKQAKQDYQMLDDSEITAITVGLKLAGYPNSLIGKGVTVDDILSSSHAIGILKPGDIITALNGKPIQTPDELINGIKTQTSYTVRLTFLRNGKQITSDVPLIFSTTAAETPKLGIQISPAGYIFNPPFPISIDTNKISGGPSAGLMFTLAVYNTLTSENLTGGRRIAGTGTISLDGSVGPIGGVKQKVFAAEAVGAEYFLCPVDNYADALSVAKNIKVIKIASVNQAIDFLRSLPAK